MKTIIEWLQAIGIIILMFASLYAIWIVAILMVIGFGVYVIKTILEDP